MAIEYLQMILIVRIYKYYGSKESKTRSVKSFLSAKKLASIDVSHDQNTNWNSNRILSSLFFAGSKIHACIHHSNDLRINSYFFTAWIMHNLYVYVQCVYVYYSFLQPLAHIHVQLSLTTLGKRSLHVNFQIASGGNICPSFIGKIQFFWFNERQRISVIIEPLSAIMKTKNEMRTKSA